MICVTENTKKTEGPAQEEEVDIDLKDPEVQDATRKIQMAFKKRQAKKWWIFGLLCDESLAVIALILTYRFN